MIESQVFFGKSFLSPGTSTLKEQLLGCESSELWKSCGRHWRIFLRATTGTGSASARALARRSLPGSNSLHSELPLEYTQLNETNK